LNPKKPCESGKKRRPDLEKMGWRRAIWNEVHVHLPLKPLCDIVLSYEDLKKRVLRLVGHGIVTVLPGAIVVASHGLMSVLNPSTGACKFEFHAPTYGPVCSFGEHVAAVHQNAIRIWNISTGECVKYMQSVGGAVCAITEWRGNIVSATDDGLLRVARRAGRARVLNDGSMCEVNVRVQRETCCVVAVRHGAGVDWIRCENTW
jgi:hypothetical protein